MRIAQLGGWVIALTMVFGVRSAQAGFITYTDQAAWEAAVGALGLGVSVEDFLDATLLTGLSTTNGSVSGEVFTGTAVTQFNNAGNPTVQLATGTQALGGYWDLSPGGNGDGLLFMINGTAAVPSGTQVYYQSSPYSGFLGWISTDSTLITSLRLDSPGTGVEAFSLDNLRLASGTTTSVPDPGSTFVLLGIGLTATFGAARARRAR